MSCRLGNYKSVPSLKHLDLSLDGVDAPGGTESAAMAMKKYPKCRLLQDPRLLHHVFENQAKRRPNHIAVSCGGVSLTYRELDKLSTRIAHTLLSRGVTLGSFVGLHFLKSVNLFAAMLGVLKAGAAYVPMDPKFPAERIRDICEDAGISLALSEGALGREIRGAVRGVKWLLLDSGYAQARWTGPSRRRSAPSPTGACYAIFTSGSTGRPKGVKITHKNALTFVRALKRSYRIRRTDRIYQGFSAAFDASVEEIWAAFSAGATLVVATEEISRSPADAADFIHSEKITYFSTVPSFLSMIQRDLPTVRLLVLGGETCSPELVNRWAKPGRRMLNTYGPTEATVVSTLWECVPGQPVSIGAPIEGYTAHVLDPNGKAVRPGEEGELYIGGPAVAAGYINRPALTAERFVVDPFTASGRPARLYRTSDLVRLGENGELYFLGRIDGQIKLRGFRIELAEIESVLMNHPRITAAAVSVFDMNGSKELGGFVVPKGELGREARKELAEHLRSRLPEYMVPKYLDRIDVLPMMTSGKVDRGRLPQPGTLLKGERKIVAPETSAERRILSVWSECLGIASLSVEDDFFLDLGGHSLLAAKVATELRTRLGFSTASVRHLYQHRTIRNLAAALEEATAKQEQVANRGPASPWTPAEQAFRTVPATERWLCATLQAASVVLYYLIASVPITCAVLMYNAVQMGKMTATDASRFIIIAGFMIWPAMLLLSIMIKWIVIGRYKPGRYPVWGFYYFRWWFVNLFQTLSWSFMFQGSPLMSLYYRAMGARVGKNCVIGTPLCTAYDVITIGDGATIGAETQLLGCRVEDGMLIIAPVEIGRNCFVGLHCNLGLNVKMEAGSALDDMSLLPDGISLEPGEQRRGAPPLAAVVKLPAPTPARLSRGGEYLWALIHLILIYLMGYLLIVTLLSPFLLVFAAFAVYGAAWGTLALLAAPPLGYVWHLACGVLLKRFIIGRIKPGAYSIRSAAYLRFWFLSYFLNNTREILKPLYATIFFPAVLRLFGAKIGRGVEVSTVMNFLPDLLHVKSGSFLADACLIGGSRIYAGALEIDRVHIGERTFIGNSAFVPAGASIGDDCLVGVLSVPPLSNSSLPANRRWLGSPGFELPSPVRLSPCFQIEKTFAPTKAMILQRSAVDFLRICLPGWMAFAGMLAFCFGLIAICNASSVERAFSLSPPLSLGIALLLLFASAGVKRLVRGEFQPEIKPLWSSYVWFTELINGVYESVAAHIIAPFLGTPLAAPCLRLFGCKIGQWVFVNTTLFSEYDLVEVGDYSALNLGATVQTHLFEDRVMKADRLVIKEGCSIGNMSIVLYNTVMGSGSVLAPLSVLMKGETLDPGVHVIGIPAEPVAPPKFGLIESCQSSVKAQSPQHQIPAMA
jgi:non-ribosomal peptide synthetase-like protein